MSPTPCLTQALLDPRPLALKFLFSLLHLSKLEMTNLNANMGPRV